MAISETPGPPSAASLLVLSETDLCVSITPPQDHNGVQYYVRVSAYNIKGWGPPRNSTPRSTAPSSWRQCTSVKIRGHSQEEALQKLLEHVGEPTHKAYCTENSRQLNSKRMSMSRGLKQFFHSTTKFVRLLQRGAYLASVFYQKDNILVTTEDQLPLVEIQCCSTSIVQDFLWFAKLSCAWQQVSWLQQVLSSSVSSSSSLLQNRHSILRAVAQLQSSVGTVDLGQVYFEPLKDRHGNVLLVTLREVTTSLTPNDPQLHWSPIKQMEARWSRTHLLPEPTAMDTLKQQIRRKLEYHRRSLQRAQPGLYVGILKLCSSVEQLRVLVPQRLPNLLLHTRIRNNAHVSWEEWSWLQRHSMVGVSGSGQTVTGSPEDKDNVFTDSTGVEEFVRDLRTAITQLLTKLNIPLYRAYQYRLYTQELVQVGDEISMLLLLPPNEEFSSSFCLLQDSLDIRLTMPLHIFEMVHFWVYSRELLSMYCQAWVRLELESYLSQQALREALDSREVAEAREKLTHITKLFQSVDAVWRERRWIMDVMQCVRSRQHLGAVPLHLVMDSQPIRTHQEKQQDGRSTHTHILNTAESAVSSLEACTQKPRVTAPVDIPGATEVTGSREKTHTPASPSFAMCSAISHSIPDTCHRLSDPCSHSSGTFHHSNIGIHHIHSCPELSAIPSSSLSISEEEDEDEEQNIEEENAEIFNHLEISSHLEPAYSVQDNKDHGEPLAYTLRKPDLVSALENTHPASSCPNTVTNTGLESVLEDKHHRDRCSTLDTNMGLESCDCVNEVKAIDVESVHCDHAVGGTRLESVHCDNVVTGTDLESLPCNNDIRDSDVESVSSANVVKATDLESVHCDHAVRVIDVESAHCNNAVGGSRLESVHCDNVVTGTDLESLHCNNDIRDSDVESVSSANVVRATDLESVYYETVVRDIDVESIHCANNVKDSDLGACTNAVRITDLESIYCENAVRSTVHCDKVIRATDLESVHCPHDVRDPDLKSVHCTNAARPIDLEPVYYDNVIRATDLEAIHCANTDKDPNLESVHCAYAVRATDLESVDYANAVGASDHDATDLKSFHCADAVRITDVKLVHCDDVVRDTDLESVHCVNTSKVTDLKSVDLANTVRSTDLGPNNSACDVRDPDLDSVHCAIAVSTTDLESVDYANAVGASDHESVHCANAISATDLKSFHCVNTSKVTDLKSVDWANTVRSTDLEPNNSACDIRDPDLDSVQCAPAVGPSNMKPINFAHAFGGTDLVSVHCDIAIRATDVEPVDYANAFRDPDQESVHCDNVFRPTDLESVHCANEVRSTDLESVHCTKSVKCDYRESGHHDNAIGITDLESVVEVSLCVAAKSRTTSVPERPKRGWPSRSLVEWVTSSSNKEDGQ
ncbi:uncharacterized protein [Hoplias malabaricus]|uniref:uncharacterized protein n=1 Tax=Hoplias malabaricus TaxID=27720 RepID=UPI003462FC52